MYLLTSLLASASVFLFVLWYVRSKYQQEARIRSLAEPQRLVVEYQEPFTQRVAFPLVDAAVRGLLAVLPTSLIGRSGKWLRIAGDKFNVPQFFSIVLVTSTVPPAGYFMLAWIGSGGSISSLLLLPLPLLGFFGFLLPLVVLRRSAMARQKRIWRAMPNALDLMVTCVESGLSLDFALQRVAERYKGPLSDEFMRALREIALGKTRREALMAVAERVDLQDLSTFVNSIIQAETMGTSVGRVLRTQAADMRRRRRQRAEQIARQAPVKMVFPTVLFLMPSLFIITLGPMLIHLFKELGD